MSEKKGNAKRYDWDAIRRAYRTGALSDAELARQHGCSRTAIQKRAKKEGWAKDSTSEVRQSARAKLVSEDAAVARGLQAGVAGCNAHDLSEIELAAETRVTVVREHRKDIARGRQLVALLSYQLLEAAQNRVELEAEIDKETAEDSGANRRNKMLRAVSLPGHAAVARDLSTAFKNLIGLERQAFGLNDDDGGDDPVLMPEVIELVAPGYTTKDAD